MFEEVRTNQEEEVALQVIPITLKQANGLVASWHRHHKPVVSHRFSLGATDEEGVLHGAVIVGRPVARLAGSPQHVAEVTRLVTDGTRNVCSMLYSAAARTAKAMGFVRIQTYTLSEEPGSSLRASGWEFDGMSQNAGHWTHRGDKLRRRDQPIGRKKRWVKRLNRESPIVDWTQEQAPQQGVLWA